MAQESRELEKHSSEHPDSAGARDDAGCDLEGPQPGPSLRAALQSLRPALMHVSEVPAGLPFCALALETAVCKGTL